MLTFCACVCLCVCVCVCVCARPLCVIIPLSSGRALCHMHPHTFLTSLCPQLSLTLVLALISCHPAQFSSPCPLHPCPFFLTFLSFLTRFTSPRLMSFPPAVIQHSYSLRILFPHLLSSSALRLLFPAVMQTATSPHCVSTSQSFISRLLAPCLSLPALPLTS